MVSMRGVLARFGGFGNLLLPGKLPVERYLGTIEKRASAAKAWMIFTSETMKPSFRRSARPASRIRPVRCNSRLVSKGVNPFHGRNNRNRPA
jgi:hypothetical protein